MLATGLRQGGGSETGAIQLLPRLHAQPAVGPNDDLDPVIILQAGLAQAIGGVVSGLDCARGACLAALCPNLEAESYARLEWCSTGDAAGFSRLWVR
ncbi:hypothetical protein CyaNS01_01822 [Cyanobium sp. NS01]|nr:hypothetical protein CyaNS01_01822 [Cyanobium sp. NS01]